MKSDYRTKFIKKIQNKIVNIVLFLFLEIYIINKTRSNHGNGRICVICFLSNGQSESELGLLITVAH